MCCANPTLFIHLKHICSPIKKKMKSEKIHTPNDEYGHANVQNPVGVNPAPSESPPP